jgi:hypothetical protein
LSTLLLRNDPDSPYYLDKEAGLDEQAIGVALELVCFQPMAEHFARHSEKILIENG